MRPMTHFVEIRSYNLKPGIGDESETVSYGSDEWRQGPHEMIIALIENYTEIVLVLDDATVDGLHKK